MNTLNFETYGGIESIQIIKPKEQEPGETKKLDTYITFHRDIFAYAVMDNDNRGSKKLKHKYNVQPADAWKQLLQQNTTAESMQLNEDEGHVPPIFTRSLKKD